MDSPEENPTPIVTVAVAIIDAGGVYRGLDTIAANTLTDQHVQVPADCDLTAGKYRWSAEHQRFDPLTDAQQAPPGVPTLEAVVYQLALSALALGATHPDLATYLADFKKSIDATGATK